MRIKAAGTRVCYTVQCALNKLHGPERILAEYSGPYRNEVPFRSQGPVKNHYIRLWKEVKANERYV